ncbi:MAG: AMP-binding protein [Bacteroides sp.]|nr:AMP-binding protein [Prevotella sp.]MCM1407487.1 AMP-binding protein [Treponema brennaborense]MCM1469977.1 AMP-binding protein [Bacteroides sp.]
MEEVFLTRTEFSSYTDFKQNYELRIPENFNFGYDVMDVLAEKTPDSPALVWTNDDGDFYSITFDMMKKFSDQAASFFMQHGIRRGDFVMLILQRRYEFWISMIALHKIGAVAIPATHMLTREDLVYRNNAASIKMIVAVNDAAVIKHVDDAMPDSPTVKKRVFVNEFGVNRVPEYVPNGWLDFTAGCRNAPPFPKLDRSSVSKNSDLMLGYFTSGTTSHPKLAVHDFLYPLGHIVTAKYWQHVQKGGLHLTVADSGWAKTSWGRLYGQWICETALFVYDYHAKFKPIDLLHQVEKYKITTFCAPPTIYRFLIQEDLSHIDLSSLAHCSTAGEPLSEEVFNKWKKITGLDVTEGFGQSETTVSLFNFEGEKIKPGSIGKPAPYYSVVLRDEDGEECESGVVGELCFKLDKGRFPGLVVEYYGEPEKTAAVFKDGYYCTGDTAWRDTDGYYWFVGRRDDVIKCSGYRIGTFEVESVLMQHPAVVECAVTGAPDPVRGQVVKATIVLASSYKPGNDELVKDIQRFVKTTTAPYKYPRIVEFVDALPKTASGKIMRKAIRAKDGAQQSVPSENGAAD